MTLFTRTRKRPWLADEIGVSISTVNTWFTQDRAPKVDVAVRIARALRSTVEYLVTGEDPAIPKVRPPLRAIVDLLAGLDDGDLREIRGVVGTYLILMMGEGAGEAVEDLRKKRAAGD